MHAPRMAVAKDVFDQDLGLGQVRLIPIHSAAEGVHLNPIFTNLTAFLFLFLGHDSPFLRNFFFPLTFRNIGWGFPIILSGHFWDSGHSPLLIVILGFYNIKIHLSSRDGRSPIPLLGTNGPPILILPHSHHLDCKTGGGQGNGLLRRQSRIRKRIWEERVRGWVYRNATSVNPSLFIKKRVVIWPEIGHNYYVVYRIVFTENAIDDFNSLDARWRAMVRDAIRVHLTHEPTKTE